MGEKLLTRVLAGGARDGELLNKLLHEFFEGYPAENVQRLLRSQDLEAVRAGAWILSELGPEAPSLLDEAVVLLRHQDALVRHYAVEFVGSAAGANDQRAVYRVLDLIEDSDPGVRHTVMRFLAIVPTGVLLAAAAADSPNEAGKDRRAGMALLLRMLERPDAAAIAASLSSEDPTLRRYAAAAAARIASYDEQPLRAASQSDDLDLKVFADGELRLLRLRERQSDRRAGRRGKSQGL